MNYEEYEVLIPPAHRYPRVEGAERSKFAEFVLLCLKHGIDIADMLDTYVKEFDLDRAVGSQLDFIGALVELHSVGKTLEVCLLFTECHIYSAFLLIDRI